MKKIVYYLRILLFIAYLIIMFLLIDKIYKPDFLCTIYFLLNLIYSFVLILTILSKRKTFKETFSFNALNIGISIYTFIIYVIVITNSKIDLLSNPIYFKNNYIMLSVLLIGLIAYTGILNKEEIESENENKKTL